MAHKSWRFWVESLAAIVGGTYVASLLTPHRGAQLLLLYLVVRPLFTERLWHRKSRTAASSTSDS